MRIAFLAIALVSAQVTCVVAAQPSRADSKIDRRCAYLGNCGSFTLIGNTGTAAYKIGTNRFIADIEFAREDANWWVYAVRGHGDAGTRGWAFARRPNCGKYRVLRYFNGVWREFDQSDAWGIGLGDSFGETRTVGGGEPSNQELLDSLNRIETKIDQIKAKP